MVARSRLPFDPDVVAPWSLGDGPRGCLLLHGFAGTPPELRRLGKHLAAHGWRVSAPAMAGHATIPEDLARTTWRDWAQSAVDALDALSATCDHVVVAGQSMGGAMALHLAAHRPAVEAVVTLAAPIWIRDPRLHLLPVLWRVVRWQDPDPTDVDLFNPDAVHELHSYGRRATRSILELVRLMRHVQRELPMVRQPVLLMHGGRDRTIDPANMPDIARRLLCSREVETHLLARSGHGMSVDVDREEINARALAWFDRWVPAPASAPLPAVPERPARRRNRRATSPA